ncbi:MAG TPA: hypothetical protein ENK18_22565 [Deltaproteobacteria bacterium]|nr:hypothetical protein [Deltaproteobacteria bacterium]
MSLSPRRSRAPTWMGLLAVAVLTSASQPGWAADGEDPIVINQVRDIYPLLPPPDARRWDPAPVVEAIEVSTGTFTPADVYALVDREVQPEIIEAVSHKAALFYDPTWRSLDAQRIAARTPQPPRTISIHQDNFAVLFEFFNDIKNDILQEEAALGPLQRGPSETDSLFERRSRKHTEDLILARGPHEARIEATTFDITLPASVQQRDGCSRAVASVDLSHLDFELFRLGMGVRSARNDVSLRSSSIESARFDSSNGGRFEVIGRCGSTGRQAKLSITRTHDGSWSGTGGL